jgi:DUF1365 family protein
MLLEHRTGSAPAGPIRLLTHLRTFGHCFNPVSFYYCFTPQEQLDAVVAEVTSTPWGERHAYVLERSGEGPVLAASFAKALARLTAHYPAATLRLLALIYGHALALKLKGVPLHHRPEEPA